MDKEYYKNLLEKNNSKEIDAENMWDTRAQSFNKAQQNDKTDFANNVTKLLKDKQILNGKNVLDIGGGSGRYALYFSQFAKSITVTDISKNMLDLTLENAKKQDIDNIYVDKLDFENANIKELGLYKKFDLSFSSMCPALRTVKGLENMIKTSKKYCVINQFVKDTDNFIQNILSKTGLKDEYHPHNDRDVTNALFNLLWLKGYNPEIRYLKSSINMRLTKDEVNLKYKKLLERVEKNTSFKKEDFLINETFEIITDTILAVILWEV